MLADSSHSSTEQKSSSSNLFSNTGNPSSTNAQYSTQKKVFMNTYKTLFFIRGEKLDSDTNKCPIYLRITKDNIRTEISLNLAVDPTRWDKRKQCVKGSSPESNSLNESLKDNEVKLRNTYNEMSRNGETITAKSLKERFLGKVAPQKTVGYLFDYYLKHIKNRVGTDFSIATLKKYEYCYNHVMNFIWKSKEVSDIPLREVDYLFVREFQQYLREESTFKGRDEKTVIKKANEHNSTLKYLKMFKTVLKEGLAFNWLSSNPFASFKDKFKEVEQVSLTEEELRVFMDKEVKDEKLAVVRDLFVFSCVTGFAYNDYKKLLVEDVTSDSKGRKWIVIPRTKTKTPCKVPLLPIAEQIISKYEQHPIRVKKGLLLPVLSNQKTNEYLKDIADELKIDKNVSTHVGRRTFTDLAINHNVPAETIIKIIGHRNFKHLHLYAKVNENKIALDMEEMNKALGDYKYPVLPTNNLKIA